MKTVLMITIVLFLSGCGGATPRESSTTPPQPAVGSSEITPPSSPSLE